VRDLFNRTLGTSAMAVLRDVLPSAALRSVALPNVALLSVALLGMAFVGTGLVPQPAWAAGLMAGPTTFGGGFHGFAGLPLVRPGQAPPVGSGGPVPVVVDRRFGFAPAHAHRRFFGFGLPVVGVGPVVGPFDAPIADAGVVAPGQVWRAPDPGNGAPISANGGDCRSETRMVSSEAGGERPIRITWCRKG
jgi:hypothetical protein